MNPYELIVKVQQRMQQDPAFAQKFAQLTQDLNNIPGLQQEVMRIMQLDGDASVSGVQEVKK